MASYYTFFTSIIADGAALTLIDKTIVIIPYIQLVIKPAFNGFSRIILAAKSKTLSCLSPGTKETTLYIFAHDYKGAEDDDDQHGVFDY